ncbi:hypothetical protein SAMN05444287_0275 [Octadecabacter temperatus]|uniref:Uncharacterized protein n=1 Tax=Octadecabacter temperatus TaxID=1458307 RepID=A0A0K0Y2L7_9RHOB|nr:DUF2125 domain-containing protein [Octadecabacter temperatus]AKS45183.1 hypothetical protein OSB_06220 [Octadecabacter temperatus]SIN87798.1 hypothetical protein SAMN05444287_0275 [Octadecabacter temperatus]
MRKLIALVVVAATLYGGYWFVGRSQIQSKLSEALVDIDAGDYDLTYDTLHTKGFPSRFDTTITNLEFNDPLTATSWAAPIFQLFALSYRPNEVIAVFPNEQTLTVDGEVFTLLTNDMRASGKVRANATLAFQTATIEMDYPRIRTEEGAELAMASILAAMRLTPETIQTYDLFLEARSIELPEDVRRMIDPQNQQPAIIQSLRFDSDIDLSAPIELNGANTDPIGLEAISIKEFALAWGEMSLSAIGDVTPDATGLLNGSFSISARNWQQLLDLAVATGSIPEERRLLIVGMAANIDETPHVPDTLTATLTITDGQMALGPIPLGAAPLLR